MLALHCDTSALAPQALGRTRAFSLVRLSDLSISTLLKTEQRQFTSVSTISFNGIQHDAGGGGVAEWRYGWHGISFCIHGIEWASPAPPLGGVVAALEDEMEQSTKMTANLTISIFKKQRSFFFFLTVSLTWIVCCVD